MYCPIFFSPEAAFEVQPKPYPRPLPYPYVKALSVDIPAKNTEKMMDDVPPPPSSFQVIVVPDIV